MGTELEELDSRISVEEKKVNSTQVFVDSLYPF